MGTDDTTYAEATYTGEGRREIKNGLNTDGFIAFKQRDGDCTHWVTRHPSKEAAFQQAVELGADLCVIKRRS